MHGSSPYSFRTEDANLARGLNAPGDRPQMSRLQVPYSLGTLRGVLNQATSSTARQESGDPIDIDPELNGQEECANHDR